MPVASFGCSLHQVHVHREPLSACLSRPSREAHHVCDQDAPLDRSPAVELFAVRVAGRTWCG
jgi:hypothetical protein